MLWFLFLITLLLPFYMIHSDMLWSCLLMYLSCHWSNIWNLFLDMSILCDAHKDSAWYLMSVLVKSRNVYSLLSAKLSDHKVLEHSSFSLFLKPPWLQDHDLLISYQVPLPISYQKFSDFLSDSPMWNSFLLQKSYNRNISAVWNS